MATGDPQQLGSPLASLGERVLQEIKGVRCG